MSLVLICKANATFVTEVSVGLSAQGMFVLQWVEDVSRITIVRRRFIIRQRCIFDEERIQKRHLYVGAPFRWRCHFIRSIEMNFALQEVMHTNIELDAYKTHTLMRARVAESAVDKCSANTALTPRGIIEYVDQNMRRHTTHAQLIRFTEHVLTRAAIDTGAFQASSNNALQRHQLHSACS